MKKETVKTEVTRFLDAWFAVRQFIQAANFNRFQGAGLSATQFMTLNLLPTDGTGLPIGDLARRMNLRAATVAKTVDSLEAREMVIRVRSDVDKRVVMVKMTPVGSDLQNAAQGQFQAQMKQLFHAMSPGERTGLILGLESLVRTATLQSGPLTGQFSHAPHASVPAKHSSQRSRLE